jgi:hypothetical protein
MQLAANDEPSSVADLRTAEELDQHPPARAFTARL